MGLEDDLSHPIVHGVPQSGHPLHSRPLQPSLVAHQQPLGSKLVPWIHGCYECHGLDGLVRGVVLEQEKPVILELFGDTLQHLVALPHGALCVADEARENNAHRPRLLPAPPHIRVDPLPVPQIRVRDRKGEALARLLEAQDALVRCEEPALAPGPGVPARSEARALGHVLPPGSQGEHLLRLQRRPLGAPVGEPLGPSPVPRGQLPRLQEPLRRLPCALRAEGLSAPEGGHEGSGAAEMCKGGHNG
mmetsp:Transcript_41705/g.112042  ORF Transcript_41705/g.112042 Transcript_41705/m.112042 type:complete len:247 (+) Transcript_41705:1261-2001(+)